jgi:hypothetical protein
MLTLLLRPSDVHVYTIHGCVSLALAALFCLSSVLCCKAGWSGGPANPGCPALSLVYFAAGLGGLLALLLLAVLLCL